MCRQRSAYVPSTFRPRVIRGSGGGSLSRWRWPLSLVRINNTRSLLVSINNTEYLLVSTYNEQSRLVRISCTESLPASIDRKESLLVSISSAEASLVHKNDKESLLVTLSHTIRLRAAYVPPSCRLCSANVSIVAVAVAVRRCHRGRCRL